MTNDILPRAPVAKPKSSNLVPVGIVLIVLGLLLPNQVNGVAAGMSPGTARSIAFVVTDVLRLCFFAGIATLIIGIVRNRKSKQTEAATGEPANG